MTNLNRRRSLRHDIVNLPVDQELRISGSDLSATIRYAESPHGEFTVIWSDGAAIEYPCGLRTKVSIGAELANEVNARFGVALAAAA